MWEMSASFQLFSNAPERNAAHLLHVKQFLICLYVNYQIQIVGAYFQFPTILRHENVHVLCGEFS